MRGNGDLYITGKLIVVGLSLLQTYPGFVDNTLDQEGNGVACPPYGFHSLFVTRIPQVYSVNLKTMERSKDSSS